MNLAKDIERCLLQILGADDLYVPTPSPSRLKSGARVYRISGTNYYHVDGEGYYIWDVEGQEKTRLTRENKDSLKKAKQYDGYISDWEFALVERGPARVEQELQTALTEKGHAVTVKIGRGGIDEGVGSGSAYPTSIRVKLLAERIKPGTTTDSAVIGEVAAISEELASVHSTVNDLVLRLRSLLITMNRRS